ncbi:hypothetical protein N7495_007195 [Penicillium taxi]|uniref:uncharacterized protein n=1 Tax=Penicillium taxi TaxID=168475 RepID=UPI002545B2CA|nr:uncharacterized protein N7495_007195 [Penicillium taxi]KAJ5895504.1 hypothetical protein N7495_007195 [Penicillium taxi]
MKTEARITSATDSDDEIDPIVEKSLLRRLDLIVLPTLALLYLTHTLDRANLGNAKTDSIEKDLHLVGNQYSLVLIFFYVPYALFNIPATILANRFSPSIVVPLLVIGWGALAMITVAVKNFGGLLACRLILGIMEAGFMPCATFYCTLFYTRKELAVRLAVFYIMGYIAGAISGLIAWSTFQWDGALKGWQYLFLIEGAMGVGTGVWAFIVLPRDIQSSRYFTPAQKICAAQRKANEVSVVSWTQGLTILKDGKLWIFAAALFFCGVGSNSSSNFLPVMVNRLTDNSVKANLYTIGPNLFAAVNMSVLAWLSDKTQQRGYFTIWSIIWALIGWVLFAALDVTKQVNVGYFFTFLIVSGTFIPVLFLPAWISANIKVTSERAVALGLMSMCQNLGGIVSSGVYRSQDAPNYRPALITVSCCLFVCLGLCTYLRFAYARLNTKLADSEKPDRLPAGEKYMV